MYFKHKYNTFMNKVSNLIKEKILTDNEFSTGLALKLGVQQQSVIGLAKRNSERLTLYKAVLFYIEKGFTIEQIFNIENQ